MGCYGRKSKFADELEESVELEEAEELDSDDEDRDESDNCISSPSTAILETWEICSRSSTTSKISWMDNCRSEMVGINLLKFTSMKCNKLLYIYIVKYSEVEIWVEVEIAW